MLSWGYDVIKNKVGVFWLVNVWIFRDYVDRFSVFVYL